MSIQPSELTSHRTLITGGAGFLGIHVTERFTAMGVALRLLDVVERPQWVVERGIEYVQGDVRDPVAVRAALAGVGVVVHAAFASPRQSSETIRSVNVEGTRTICREASARGARRLILISSTIVHRPLQAHPILRTSPVSRLNLYRTTRAKAEGIVTAFGGRSLSTAIVRPKTFIGPLRVGAFAVIFDLVRWGRPVPVLGTGRNRYQLLDVRDLAEGICLLRSSSAEGIFSLGAREFGTVNGDLQALLDHARTGAHLRHIASRWARPALRILELVGAVPLSEWHQLSARGEDSIVDASRAERELVWRPRRSNAQALRDAYDWYVSSVHTMGQAARTQPVPLAHRALQRLTWIFPR
ncbi:MAG: NAD-dependent epimerase/dehydratase family protein [bacterium]